MAAEMLAGGGFDVTVHDHRPSVGRKFLLAGRSGLNITHGEPLDDLLGRYGPASPRLAAAIRAFAPDDLRAWCTGLGQETFVGSSGRVFPEAMRATPLLRSWLARLTELGVALRTGEAWTGWADGDPRRLVFRAPNGDTTEMHADVTVLALGGASWPRVGSDGGWVPVLRGAGIDVHDLEPSNCGVQVRWSPVFLDRFEGAPVKNVAVCIDGVRIRGDITVTLAGLEGGAVYAHSPAVRRALAADGTCTLALDLLPDLAADEVARRLARRRPRETATRWLTRTVGLSEVAVSLVRESVGVTLPTDPDEMARLLTALPITVHATMPIERAISSAGGVSLDEVDDDFELRRFPGTYVVGEMLDWEAPTGGYLLQATFSTAVAAAHAAIARQDGRP